VNSRWLLSMRPEGISTFCARQRCLDLLHRDIVGRHAGAIEPDPHRILALSENADLGHAGDVLDAVGDEAVGEIGQFERSVPRARQRQIHDRLGVGLDLGDDRLVDLGRHAAAHAADAVAHVGGGDVGIDIRAEAHRDEAALLAAGRGDDLDALDAGDRVLQDLRDLRLDDLGRGAAIIGADRDDRLVDIGIFAHRQAVIGDDADQHDQQAHHRREDGPADEKFEQAHCRTLTGAAARWSAPVARFLIASVAPSRSRIWPARDDLHVGRQPLHDLDLARQALAELDATALGLAVLDDIDDLADAIGHDGHLGNDERVLALVDRDAMRAKRPGFSTRSALGIMARRRIARPLTSTTGSIAKILPAKVVREPHRPSPEWSGPP
jgi:hypothetical protein